MDAIVTVRDQLVPLAEELVEQLERDGDPDSARWFSAVRASLAAAQQEEDLIMIFIEQLGPTGPMAMGAGFSFEARLKLDTLLERAQEVAFAFSADGDAH